MKSKVFLFVIVLLLQVLIFNIERGFGEEKKLHVFVSIIPQVYFVERIGGDYVNVNVLVKPGHSPATYEITPKQMAILSAGDIFFTIGVPFEKGFVPKVKSSIKDITIVNLTEGIQLRRMEVHHHHSENSNHYEESLDPHVWLDPLLVKVMANKIFENLVSHNPSNSEYYKSNLIQFSAELDSIYNEINQLLTPLENRDFYVFHPSYGYFADRFNLNQIAIEIEGKEPGAKYLVSLIDEIKERDVDVIFVQPQFSEKSASIIADAINGTVVSIDPLAADYISNLKDIALKIRKHLMQ